jgi:hypothetical protein
MSKAHFCHSGLDSFASSAPFWEPLQKLDNSASEWKPLGELGKAERIERPEL